MLLATAFVLASCSDSQFSANSTKQKKIAVVTAEVAGDENAIIDGLGDIGTGSSDKAGSGEGDATATSGSGSESDVSGSTAKSDGLSSVNDCVTARLRGYLVETTPEIIDYPNNFKFPNQCTWPGGKKDSVSGFREVRHTFSPPGGRVVCKMSLESSLRYDDSILLTLNDRALIWGSLGTTVYQDNQIVLGFITELML